MINVINFPRRSVLVKLLAGPKVFPMPHMAKNNPKLIKKARTLAKKKGHILGEVSLGRIVTGYPPVTYRMALSATCERCEAQIGIDPEHGAIFGEVLEGDCKGNWNMHYLDKTLDLLHQQGWIRYKDTVTGDEVYQIDARQGKRVREAGEAPG